MRDVNTILCRLINEESGELRLDDFRNLSPSEFPDDRTFRFGFRIWVYFLNQTNLILSV